MAKPLPTDEIDKLRRCRGLTAADAAAHIGIDVRRARHLIRKHAVRGIVDGRKPKPEIDAAIKARYATEPTKTLAAELNMTMRAVSQRAAQLRVAKIARIRASTDHIHESERAWAVGLWHEGVSLYLIARKLERTESEIRIVLALAGVKHVGK